MKDYEKTPRYSGKPGAMKNVAWGCLKITNWTVTEARHLTNNVDVDVVSAGDG